MKLEEVTAEIRPRGRWESVDLGCALVRENYGVIIACWFMTVVPIWIVLGTIGYWFYTNDDLAPALGISSPLYFIFWNSWLLFILWWLKPIYDKVPLYIISRSLFGEKVKIGTMLKAWPKLVFKDIFKLLITRRISASRSLAMPVSELENLKGKAYKSRVRLLSRNGGDGASNVTMSSLMLEHMMYISCLLFIVMTYAYQIDMDVLLENTWEYIQVKSHGFAAVIIGFSALFYVIAITIMEPFYVGSGFALYVNSRTITEGWDIELAFKRMTERIENMKQGVKNVASLLLAVSYTHLTLPTIA